MVHILICTRFQCLMPEDRHMGVHAVDYSYAITWRLDLPCIYEYRSLCCRKHLLCYSQTRPWRVALGVSEDRGAKNQHKEGTTDDRDTAIPVLFPLYTNLTEKNPVQTTRQEQREQRVPQGVKKCLL